MRVAVPQSAQGGNTLQPAAGTEGSGFHQHASDQVTQWPPERDPCRFKIRDKFQIMLARKSRIFMTVDACCLVNLCIYGTCASKSLASCELILKQQ